jgi:hypothetical protein
LCQRYYSTAYGYQRTYITGNGIAGISVTMPVTMRAVPTYTTLAEGSSNLSTANYTYAGTVQAQQQYALIYASGAAIGVASLSVSFSASAEL